MLRVRLAVALAAVAAVGAADILKFNGDGCTSIIAGKKATADGSTFASHTNDCMECDFRISKVPAADHPPNSTRAIYAYRAAYPRYLGDDRGDTYKLKNTDTTIYPWAVGEGVHEPIGEIPQVPHTYSYYDGGYGIMNEFQLSMGESTCGAKITALPVHKGGKALMEMGELSRIAMERCKTARCAIELMGSLAEQYGFYGADSTEGESGESMQVIDTQEAWVFHILPDDTGASAIWVAQRVPDNGVAAVANQFIIHKVDMKDKDNFMGSANLKTVAKRLKFWDPKKEDFDFTHAYAMDRGHLYSYATRRVWRIFDLVAPSSHLSPYTSTFADDYPFAVAPDKPISAMDVLRIHRDHYEGTDFDMTKGLAGGPYGDPSRFDPGDTHAVYPGAEGISEAEAWSGSFERAISIYRASYSWVSQARAHVPDELGLVWFSQYAPHATQSTPLYMGASKIPKPFTVGSLLKFDPSSAYWVHAMVGNWADRFYIHTIGDIQALQSAADTQLEENQPGVEAEVVSLVHKNKTDAVAELLDEYSESVAAQSLKSWTDFFYLLVAKYKDGQRIDDFHAQTTAPTKLFYPRWWLEKVGYLFPGSQYIPTVGDSEAQPPAASGSLFWSHLAVAILSMGLTAGFFKYRTSGDKPDEVKPRQGAFVELPSHPTTSGRRPTLRSHTDPQTFGCEGDEQETKGFSESDQHPLLASNAHAGGGVRFVSYQHGGAVDV